MTIDLFALAQRRALAMAKFVHLDGMAAEHSKDIEERQAWREAKRAYMAVEQEYQRETSTLTTKEIEALEQSLKAA